MLQSTAGFLTFKTKAGAVVHRWQNRWSGQTVDGHSFMPFLIQEINSSVAAASDSVSLSLPEMKTTIELVEQAVADAYVVQLIIKKYPDADSTAGTVVAQTTGEVIGATLSIGAIQVDLGSSLDPVGAQIPPRRFTTTILGAPARR
jgi:hypothetical protein